MAEEVVDITAVAEEEEINITLAVVVDMVAECSNNSKMINITKEAVVEAVVAAAGITKATIKAMATSIKADTAVRAEGEDTGVVEVRTEKNNQPRPFHYINSQPVF